ncbi:PIR protein [Plasmodium malariae]|uniref:PIR protein n=1 Tax=Plasmodium malariae TaxID=5858 RepID=A0A1D3JI37_PLAMA|nr:PIR protein [Plasmodium malariae]SBT86102.1 PIR protein [Plasmodium malariae]
MENEVDLGLSLPSVLNYNNLNRKISYLSDTICGKLDEDLRDYEDIFGFCVNIKGVIEKFNELSFYGEFTNERCIVVKLWMYDRLFNLRIKDNKVNDINNIINKVKEMFNDNDPVKECKLFDSLYLKEDFYKMKSLYDYATNYKTIKGYLNDNSYICNKNLKDYINKNDELYINGKQKCEAPDTGNMEYCRVFEYFKEPYLNKNLPLSCKVKHEVAEVSEQEQYMTIEGEGPSAASGMLSQSNAERTEFIAVRRHPQTSILTTEDKKNAVPFSGVIMAVIFPLLGIFIFFILYKFTPFKSRLNTHLFKKKIIEDYEDEEYIQEHLNESYHTNGNHIRYHPL